MESLSSVYAGFVLDTRYESLKPEVIRQAKSLILDLLGVSLAGYQSMEFPRWVVQYLAGLGGTPEATIFQTRKKYPALNAVFANASCAHAIDMDDGHRYGALHPGTVIIPAALGAAELAGATTKDFITGVVAGYEVMIRVGAAINPSSLNRGFHATGITGTFGAAAAGASILNLTLEETIGAFGMAGLQSAGVLQINHDVEGAKVKPINPARAAQAGLFACILAQKGAKGPLHIFEGEDGYLKAFTDKVNPDWLTRELGQTFEICNAYVKFYAACRHVHACVDAALEAVRTTPVKIPEIKKITIETYPAAIRLAGIVDVTTPSAARFSIPYSVALALVRGNAGADQYTEENIRNREIRDLAGKIEFSVGKKWEEAYPNKRGASVRITDRHGREGFAEVDLAKGEPENPASWEEVYNKFFTNATLLISEQDARALGEGVMNLEERPLQDILRFL
jgi:2-methylcitrate dehydratase PrpD